ncbi:MAG: amidohydrolase family protein [Planctomycetota bacterium]|nr:MAG: amidohydrolase family protein [Planctomycetota bacterium]
MRRIALVLVALALISAPPAHAGVTVIHCGALLAVPGQAPVHDATVVVEDGLVREVRPRLVDPARFGADARFIDLADRFVLPGLIDCHTHITGQMSPDFALRAVQDSEADVAIRATVYARRTLEAGFTTIRNLGSEGDSAFALRDAINAGVVPGPRILCAGQAVTPTGGHGDVHGYREGLLAIPTEYQGVADGADSCRKAVRAQVKRGADVIKITATGGVLSRIGAGVEQQFFPDELESIVQAAHLLGKKVAAHAHGTRGINAALRAGVDSIEHGSYLDDESISLFLRTGAYYVPTLMAGEVTVRAAQENPDYFTPEVRAKALAVGPEMIVSFGKAHAAGVKIAFGTDSGVSPHGDNAREFELMVEGGMSPAEAVAAATVHAADLLGLSDEIGTIQPGKRADLIAVASDPTRDVSALKSVTFVMKDGAVFKNQP